VKYNIGKKGARYGDTGGIYASDHGTGVLHCDKEGRSRIDNQNITLMGCGVWIVFGG
jgi:hypothetical protein